MTQKNEIKDLADETIIPDFISEYRIEVKKKASKDQTINFLKTIKKYREETRFNHKGGKWLSSFSGSTSPLTNRDNPLNNDEEKLSKYCIKHNWTSGGAGYSRATYHKKCYSPIRVYIKNIKLDLKKHFKDTEMSLYEIKRELQKLRHFNIDKDKNLKGLMPYEVNQKFKEKHNKEYKLKKLILGPYSYGAKGIKIGAKESCGACPSVHLRYSTEKQRKKEITTYEEDHEKNGLES